MMKSIIVGASALFLLIVFAGVVKRMAREIAGAIAVYTPLFGSIGLWGLLMLALNMTAPINVIITFYAFLTLGGIVSMEVIERLTFGESFILQ